MASQVRLEGGQFQDSEGNPLEFRYFTMRLNQDEMVNDSQVCSGIIIKILLDDFGNCVYGQYVWANSDLLPVNSFYTVTVYSAQGQIVWGPNNQQVASGSTFDVGTWVPNSVISWSPSVQSLDLEINSAPASSQTVQNLVDSASVTVIDNGSGEISFTALSGVPAGTNIAASLPWSGQFFTDSLMNGTSNLEVIPATSIVNNAASWKVAIYLVSGSFTTTQIFLLRTLKGSLTTVDITPITFGGVADPTFSTAGFNYSDIVNLPIDAVHDCYFILEVPYPGGGGEIRTWQLATQALPPYNGGSTNTGGTDLTAAWASAVPAIGTALPVGAGAVWMAAWVSA